MPDPAPTATAPVPFDPARPIVARGSTEYRVKRFIMVFILVGAGCWFGYDGFYGYPAENKKVADVEAQLATARAAAKPDETELTRLEGQLKTLKKHTDTDIRWQRNLFFMLPPVGLAVLIFALYNSRGRYHLQNDVLSVPGHPPVPLDAITAIDKTHWDRKGIAWLDYELPNGKIGRLRLDDFIYQRVPTDDIYKRVEEVTGTAEDAPPSDAAPSV